MPRKFENSHLCRIFHFPKDLFPEISSFPLPKSLNKFRIVMDLLDADSADTLAMDDFMDDINEGKQSFFID